MSVSTAPTPSVAPGVLTPADLSGWPLDPRERGDFYHPPRAFPPEVAIWRRRLVERLLVQPRPFRGVRSTTSIEDLRRGIDAGTAFVEVVPFLEVAGRISEQLARRGSGTRRIPSTSWSTLYWPGRRAKMLTRGRSTR